MAVDERRGVERTQKIVKCENDIWKILIFWTACLSEFTYWTSNLTWLEMNNKTLIYVKQSNKIVQILTEP